MRVAVARVVGHYAGEDLRMHLVPVGALGGMIDDGAFIQALHTAPLLKYLLGRHRRQPDGAR